MIWTVISARSWMWESLKQSNQGLLSATYLAASDGDEEGEEDGGGWGEDVKVDNDEEN